MLSVTRFWAGWPVVLLLMAAGCRLLSPTDALTPRPSPAASDTEDLATTALPVDATRTAIVPSASSPGSFATCSGGTRADLGSMWLAFDAEWDGDSEIYIIKADGDALTKPTDNDIEDFRPLWSPDGERIAFLSGSLSEKEYRLYIMNVDGSQRTLVSADLRVPGDYAWSPDSHELAFDARQGHGPANLYIASRDGSSLTAVTQNDGRFTLIGSPAWSPDGQTIAFSASLDEWFLIWHVFRVGSDGSTLRDLSPDTARVEDVPEWHPAADSVLFRSQTASNLSQLYVMKADGSQRRQLTTGEDLKGSASWSPDGELVAYEVSDDSLYLSAGHDVDTIYVVTKDGSEPQVVYVAEKWAKLAGWGPDSRHLAFTVSHGQTWDLAVLDICDGSLRTIVEDVSGRYRASWKP